MKNSYFDLNTISQGHFNVTYRGIPMQKSPFDYLLYQMLIFKVKPDLIIEIGTNAGGGSLYLSDLIKTYNPYGRVHTIDIPSNKPMIESNHSIFLFNNGWENYDIESFAFEYNPDSIIVIDDGSHVYKDVIGAWNKFNHIIELGSYYIIEDGIIDDLELPGFDGGPLRAIKEITSTSDKFIIDETYCNFFGKNATFNVDGYLKRVR